MLFNSAHFLIYFPVVLTLYFLFPHRFRWVFLLAASYYFYMCWRWEYTVLIIASTLTDYWVALKIADAPDGDKRKRWIYLSLFLNLGLLFTFKYFNFFLDSAAFILHQAGMDYAVPLLDVALPVGISFYTFQSLAYTVDVYRGVTKPERHLGLFALFVVFWPQLVAGPIERSQHLLPQFRMRFAFDYDRVVWGLNKVAYGFFKKVVVADRLAIYVNEVYGNVDDYPTIPLVIASIFFAFQIYCDFSGYTDIAIGCAAMMGFSLMENFDRPYLSRSITEFWRRWHISLSTWFKDYVYIPLGGKRVAKWRWYYNLFLTFLLSGLWHGANWTFVIWGALHGFYLVTERFTEETRTRWSDRLRLYRWKKVLVSWQVLTTFVLVLIGWIFFRAVNVQDAVHVLQKMARPDLSLNASQLMAYNGPYNFALSFLALGLLALSYFLPKDLRLRHSLLFVIVTIMLIILIGKGGESEFIYFQF